MKPPSSTGGPPTCAGRRSTFDGGISQKRPLCSTELSAQSFSKTSSISSSRAPRSSQGTPATSYSSRIQLVPSPSSSRPSLTASRLVSARASSTALCQVGISVLNDSRTRLVTTAAAVKVTIGSSAAVNSGG